MRVRARSLLSSYLGVSLSVEPDLWMGWTIALRATGAQGAWTTLWTGVDGPKRRPPTAPPTGIAHTHAPLPTPSTGPMAQ